MTKKSQSNAVEPVHCSNLGNVMACAACHQHLAGQEDYDSDLALFGRAFHDVMAQAVRDGVVNYDKVQLQYSLDSEQIEDLKDLARRCIYKLNLKGWSVQTEREYSIDKHCRPTLPTATGEYAPILTGRLDLLAVNDQMPNLALLPDYKSGWADHDNWQVIGYTTLAFAHIMTLDLIHPQYHYPRKGTVVERLSENGDPLPYTREEIVNLWPQIRARCEEAMSRKSKPTYTTTARCQWCSPWTCPAWKQSKSLLLSGKGITKEMPANALAAQEWMRQVLPKLKVLQGVCNEVDAMARAIVEQYGAIDLGDGTEYACRTTQYNSIDLAKAWPVLLNYTDQKTMPILETIGVLKNTTFSEFVSTNFPRVRGKYKEIFEALKAAGAVTTEDKPRVSIYPKKSAQPQLTEKSE